MMKNNRYLQIGLLYFLALLIHGCATRAQMQSQRLQQQANETAKIAKACGEQAKASDVGKRLQRILIMSENDPAAFEKMMIDRVAAESERRDFIDYHNIIQPCRTQIIEGYSKVHPLFVNLFAKSFAENDEMALKMLKGDITLGDANAWMNKITALRRQAFFDVGRESIDNWNPRTCTKCKSVPLRARPFNNDLISNSYCGKTSRQSKHSIDLSRVTAISSATM
jgi:hypothetical protein